MTPEDPTDRIACYRHPDRLTGLGCSECGRPICASCAVAGTVGQFCPDCVAARGTQKIIRAPSRAGGLRSAAPVTFALMATTIGIYALRYIAPELTVELYQLLAQANILVAEGEFWRIFTPVFLHAATFHIFFNMWALYQLGPALEQRLGAAAYLGLYFACAAVGGAFAYLLGDQGDVLVGASGAIFGLFGIWFHTAIRARGTAWGRSLLGNLGLVLLLNAALPFLYRQISWQGHLGGFLAGLLIGQAWTSIQEPKLRPVVPVALAVLAVLTVLTF